MPHLNHESLMSALRGVKDPELGKDVVTLNLVRDARITGDGDVEVHIALPDSSGWPRADVERAVGGALQAAGARSVRIGITGGTARSGGAGARPGGAPGGASIAAPQGVLPQVKHVVAVGAGKGGVGKSTLSANLAVGLSRRGLNVGLMDGDIYGPSMPTMLGIRGLAPQVRGNKIVPFFVHGIHAITIGALVEQDKPLIWRGPMAHGAFKQLLLDNTQWPELDYLIVDLPPGTGDVPLTLCQLLPLTGAVVVATPQQVALDDCLRAVRMFQQLGAPILGIVENMSYLPLPDGTILDMFGRGGAERAARDMGLAFLGAVPMYPELRVNSDAGDPEQNFASNPALASSLDGVVDRLVEQVKLRDKAAAAPVLEIS